MSSSRLMREGSVGLFFLLGVILFGGVIFFLRGTNLQTKNYQVKLLFENAGGLREGARVYYRGVGVGRITAINPSSNGVEVSTEIDGNLRIPQDVTVSTLRTGLLGEVSVNVIPKTDLDERGKEINPFAQECNQQNLILCHNQKIGAKSTPDLVESLAAISDRINNDKFFEQLDTTIDNFNQTTEKMSVLTDEVTSLAVQLRKDMKTVTATTEKIGKTADSFTQTAKVTSEQIEKLGNSYSDTAVEFNLLADNFNRLIDENKTNFSNAIANFSQTTAEIGQLVENTDQLLARVNPDDVAKISENLGNTSENLSEISEDLKEISDELNNSTNLVSLQQTLDSARVTFANTAKITSDIDEFTGDPEFRSNLRRLIDGLGSLVSYTEILERQVELATLLEQVEKVTTKENPTLDNNTQKFPTAFSNNQVNSKPRNLN